MASHSKRPGQTSTLQPVKVPEPPWSRHTLRVPRQDESVYADPPLADAAELARQNQEHLSGCPIDIQGRTLDRLRRWTREAVLEAARDYTARLADESVPAPSSELVIASGHQPSLYHPGVWAKNFAIAALASRVEGTALNLIVDNDTFSTTRIRLPAGDRRHPRIETEPFDADLPRQPWEEAHVHDAGLFRSFADRVAGRMSGWGIEPLLVEMWPRAIEQLKTSDRLADCLSAARHRQECRWGAANLELPTSWLCRLEPFLWFAGHILAQLPRFRDVHNGVLAEFRQVNRIRSRTHPVPELQETDGWLEAPFWVWREGEHVRRQVYARQTGGEVRLSDGLREFVSLRLTPEADACCAVEELRELPQRGIRFRTRALTTTLFARLCLSDLFVHGIGGAKYDEMTDRIIARFFRLPPPGFLTLSATVHLPIAEPFDVDAHDARRLRRLLRDLRCNPQRHVRPERNSEAAQLVNEKRRLIAEQNAAENAVGSQDSTRRGAGAAGTVSAARRRRRSRDNYRRFQRLQQINEQLAPFVSRQRRRAEEELQSVAHRLDANAILKDREFPFCLYPADKLRRFMTTLGEQA